MDFYERFLAQMSQSYPETARAFDVRARLTPHLLCPEVISLPHTLAEQAGDIVSAFFALRESPERRKNLESQTPAIADPGNYSALMSFDFHVDDAGNLRLIEINTNASNALTSDLIYKVHGVSNAFCADFKTEILETFKNEFALAMGSGKTPRCAAIVDENPESQKLYVEFLWYAENFRRSGMDVVIADPSRLSCDGKALVCDEKSIDLVYNRHTDFYFETPETAALARAMQGKLACISPHPHEYRLLADKERLMEISDAEVMQGLVQSGELSQAQSQVIGKALIRTVDLSTYKDPREIWNERKKWFFKPKRMYGGKAAYRGSSISHPAFQRLLDGTFLAQEFVPAPTVKIGANQDEFKYDLRFYVYRDKIQIACARLYQGQMTNAHTPGGGIAAIRWI